MRRSERILPLLFSGYSGTPSRGTQRPGGTRFYYQGVSSHVSFRMGHLPLWITLTRLACLYLYVSSRQHGL